MQNGKTPNALHVTARIKRSKHFKTPHWARKLAENSQSSHSSHSKKRKKTQHRTQQNSMYQNSPMHRSQSLPVFKRVSNSEIISPIRYRKNRTLVGRIPRGDKVHASTSEQPEQKKVQDSAEKKSSTTENGGTKFFRAPSALNISERAVESKRAHSGDGKRFLPKSCSTRDLQRKSSYFKSTFQSRQRDRERLFKGRREHAESTPFRGDITARQEWLVPKLSETSPLRTAFMDSNLMKSVPQHTTYSSFQRDMAKINSHHSSYDIDGDGVVGIRDLKLAKQFDRDRNGYLDEEEIAKGRLQMVSDYVENYRQKQTPRGTVTRPSPYPGTYHSLTTKEAQNKIENLLKSKNFEAEMSKLEIMRVIQESVKGEQMIQALRDPDRALKMVPKWESSYNSTFQPQYVETQAEGNGSMKLSSTKPNRSPHRKSTTNSYKDFRAALLQRNMEQSKKISETIWHPERSLGQRHCISSIKFSESTFLHPSAESVRKKNPLAPHQSRREKDMARMNRALRFKPDDAQRRYHNLIERRGDPKMVTDFKRYFSVGDKDKPIKHNKSRIFMSKIV
eukprot:g4251.t1